tara:strand:+ start:843 stop:1607 length:765 start_codon:yes stop_codon:yes gene_type:complete
MQKESWFKLDEIMEDLQAVREIFHSEDDLKFSLATVIQKKYPNAEVRLERPSKVNMVRKCDGEEEEKTISIDITVFKDKESRDKDIIFLELKYKTRLLKCDIDGDKYQLTNQGAVDIGRFLFRKDIYRLEQAIKDKKNSNCKGYFIVITNDAGYEKDISDNEVLNKNYSFHNKKKLVADDPGWNYRKKNGTTSNIKSHPDKGDKHWSCGGSMAYKLDLRNEYIINWEKYSEISQQDVEAGKDLIFRHCIIEVSE